MSLSFMKDWLLDFLLNTIGWGGLLAIFSGVILIFSLSARAFRFLHSPRGIATAAGMMVIGLAIMWWFAPTPTPGVAAPYVARQSPISKPSIQRAEAEPPMDAIKAEPLAELELERLFPETTLAAKQLPPLDYFYDPPPPVSPAIPHLAAVPIPQARPPIIVTHRANPAVNIQSPAHQPAHGNHRQMVTHADVPLPSSHGHRQAAAAGYNHPSVAMPVHHGYTAAQRRDMADYQSNMEMHQIMIQHGIAVPHGMGMPHDGGGHPAQHATGHNLPHHLLPHAGAVHHNTGHR